MPTKKTKSPEDKIRALEKRIKALEERSERLIEQVAEANWRATHLTVCKLDDPRMPFFNWLAMYARAEEREMAVKAVLGILLDRVSGERPHKPKRLRGGIPAEWYEREGPPTKEEILEMLRTASGLNWDYQIIRLLHAMAEQGLYPALSDYVTELFDFPR